MRVMQQWFDPVSGGGGDGGFPTWGTGTDPTTTAPTAPATDPTTQFTSPTTPTGPATPSPYPQGGATTGGDPGWLSSMNNFLGSNTGQAVVGGAVGLEGLIAAKQAQSNAQKLTGAISGAALPGQQLSNATYRQLTGGAPVGGPMGTYIAGTTGAANQLAATAGTYATGQLTPAQQLQVKQNQAAQNAQFATTMGGPGGMGLDSSAAAAMRTQNANNAAMLTQAIEQNNIQIATAALQGATQTYNQLLTSALNQADLGYQATANAVKQQLQANQQVSTAIQQLLQSIVQGYTAAQKPQNPNVAQQPGGGTPSLMQTAGGLIGKGLQGMGGGGGTAASSGLPSDIPPIAAGAPTWIPQDPNSYPSGGPQLQNVQLTDIPSDFTPTPAATDTGATATGTGD